MTLTYAVWGAWAGIAAGLLELALLGWDQYISGRVIYQGPHVIWMAPLAEGLLGCLAGLAAGVLRRLAPRLPEAWLAFAAFFPATFGIAVYFHPRLHAYAGLVLAAGAAAQAGRLVAVRVPAFNRLVRRTLPLAAGIVVLLAAGTFGYDAWRTRAEAAQLGPRPDGAPNVLLIVLDTVRAKSLSLHGYPRRTTPSLETFAQAGVRFDRAFATSPWTAPTHAGLFTGQYPGQLSVDWSKPLDDTYPTLAEHLRARGYNTMAFVGNVVGCSYERGLGRGFIEYRDYPVSVGQLLQSSALIRGVTSFAGVRRLTGWYEVLGRKSGEEVSNTFLAWLDKAGGDRPYFAFLNYYDAHAPYLPRPPYDTMFGSNVRPNPWATKRWWNGSSPQVVESERIAYEGAIAQLDAEIGRLLDALRRRGGLDRTVVIITSDHGEEFGEHGSLGHGRTLYSEVIHVPLVIVYPPAVPAGTVVTDPVTLRDVPATVSALTGSNDRLFAGLPLSRFWDRREPPAEPIPMAQQARVVALVRGPYHYIRNGRGRERLYDLVADPDEQHDLADTEPGRRLLEEFRLEAERLAAAERRSGSPRRAR